MSAHNIAPDSAHPFVVDVSSLGKRPGNSEPLRSTIVLPERFGLDLIGFAAGSNLDCDLQLQSVSDGVVVTGTFTAVAQGLCARCVSDFSRTFESSVAELFVYTDDKAGSPRGAANKKDIVSSDEEYDDDEVYFIHDRFLDLEQLVIDSLVSQLSFHPLCNEDCAGLCSECGLNRNDQPDHVHEVIDPRFAQLKERFAHEDNPGDAHG